MGGAANLKEKFQDDSFSGGYQNGRFFSTMNTLEMLSDWWNIESYNCISESQRKEADQLVSYGYSLSVKEKTLEVRRFMAFRKLRGYFWSDLFSPLVNWL